MKVDSTLNYQSCKPYTETLKSSTFIQR